jgi:ATP-dependent RNA helicase RhlE
MPEEVMKLADEVVRDAKYVQIGSAGGPAKSITHTVESVPAAEKTEWLAKFLRRTEGPVLVFVRTKSGAERLARKLASFGLKAAALHADRTQQQRTHAVEGFRSGSYRVLVATDVAARGLDIDDLPLVVNYELPHVPEDYIHRIGRTGRAGASGEAISLVAPDEERYLADIERLLKKKVEIVSAEGFDLATARFDKPERTSRGKPGERPARAPRETSRAKSAPAAERAAPVRTERSAARPARAPSHGESRREERERAYALNPDQPPVARPAEPAAPEGHAAHGKSFGHGRQVPALLMKRKSSEPEKV